MPAKFVINHNDNSVFPSKTYEMFKEKRIFENTTNDRLNVHVNIPKYMSQYQPFWSYSIKE
jgi:hypothetical protein